MEENKTGVNNGSVTPTEQPTAGSETENSSSPVSDDQNTQSSGVNTGVGKNKTYSEEEVNRILHLRTKEYSEKIKKLEEEINKIKQPLKSQQPAEKETSEDLSPEDKMFLDYFQKKILPKLELGIKKEHLEFLESLKERETLSQQQYLKSGEEFIEEQLKELKFDENSIALFKDLVAAKILNDENLLMSFKLRDPNVFKKAFEDVRNSLQGLIQNKAKEEVKNIVKTKNVASNVKQPVQGIGAPLTQKKPLSDEEIIDLAFKMVSGNE